MPLAELMPKFLMTSHNGSGTLPEVLPAYSKVAAPEHGWPTRPAGRTDFGGCAGQRARSYCTWATHRFAVGLLRPAVGGRRGNLPSF